MLPGGWCWHRTGNKQESHHLITSSTWSSASLRRSNGAETPTATSALLCSSFTQRSVASMIIFVLWHCLRLGGAIFLPWLRRCLLGQSFPAAIHYTNSQPVSYIHTASPPHSSSAASVVRLRLRLRLGQGGCGCQDGCGSLSYCHLPHLTGTHSAAAWWISTYLHYLLYLVPLLTLELS